MYKRKRMGTAVGVCICAALMFGTATAFAAGQAETGAMSGGPGEIKLMTRKNAGSVSEYRSVDPC